MGQMVEDVKLALEGTGEVHFYGRPGGIIPTPLELSRVIASQYYQKTTGVTRIGMKKVFSRPKSLKRTAFHYCPGCGHSIIHRLIGEVIDEMDLREKIIGVPPAGCAVLAYNYLDIDMGEAAHGRAAAVATGLKRVLPDRVVFTYQGDGDIAAIGTAETIHAAARGENRYDDLCQ